MLTQSLRGNGPGYSVVGVGGGVMGEGQAPVGLGNGLGEEERGECQRPLCGVSRGVGGRSVGKCLGKGPGVRFSAGYGGAGVHPREGAGIHSGGESSQWG